MVSESWQWSGMTSDEARALSQRAWRAVAGVRAWPWAPWGQTWAGVWHGRTQNHSIWVHEGPQQRARATPLCAGSPAGGCTPLVMGSSSLLDSLLCWVALTRREVFLFFQTSWKLSLVAPTQNSSAFSSHLTLLWALIITTLWGVRGARRYHQPCHASWTSFSWEWKTTAWSCFTLPRIPMEVAAGCPPKALTDKHVWL